MSTSSTGLPAPEGRGGAPASAVRSPPESLTGPGQGFPRVR